MSTGGSNDEDRDGQSGEDHSGRSGEDHGGRSGEDHGGRSGEDHGGRSGGDHGGRSGEDGDGRRSGEMTLVFTLAAIRQFSNPADVFADARQWSPYVGVVDNDTDAVADFVAEHDLRQDFDLGEADKWLAMEQIRGATATPRHVFVGTTVEDRRIADHLGWEYRQPHEVAEKADWTLERDESGGSDTGLVERIRGILPGGSG